MSYKKKEVKGKPSNLEIKRQKKKMRRREASND